MTTSERAQAIHQGLDKMSEEERFSVFKTLYHHKDVTPVMVGMITGVIMETAEGEEPFDMPLPTAEEKEFSIGIVNELISLYFDAFNEACVEVTGEPLADWEPSPI